MTSTKYIGMDVHKESISIAVMNASGKIGMEGVMETKASIILQFFDGLRGDLQVMFEEGTSAAWFYELAETARDEIAGVRSAKECLHEGRQRSS
jgi:glycerate kinase